MKGLKKQSKTAVIYTKALAVLASRRFFIFVLTLLTLQAAWYAFSFQPSINDEPQHLGNIYFYAEHISPFVSHQDQQWDKYGEISRNGSYMFYYLMSWPLRVVKLFTDSYMAQVIVLRLINIAFVIIGLIYYKKALQQIKRLSDGVLNFIFLLLVLTPSVALLPGAVNYDNLIFLMFGYIFYLSIRQLKSNSVQVKTVAAILILSLLSAVIKWTSIALLIPLVAFLAVDLYKRHGVGLFTQLWQQLKSLSRAQLLVIILAFAVTGALFVERPVLNTLRYKNPNPSCQRVLDSTRCQSYPNYYIYQNILKNKSPAFDPDKPPQYVVDYWVPKMIDTASNQLEVTTAQLPIITAVFTLGVCVAALAIVLCLRELVTDKFLVFLLIIIVGYVGFLLLNEYGSYVKYGIPAAIRARYLIPVLPLIAYLAVVSIAMMFGRYRKTLLASALLLVVLMTQGGGIVTYALTTPQNLYWSNHIERSINNGLKKILDPLVKGG